MSEQHIEIAKQVINIEEQRDKCEKFIAHLRKAENFHLRWQIGGQVYENQFHLKNDEINAFIYPLFIPVLERIEQGYANALSEQIKKLKNET